MSMKIGDFLNDSNGNDYEVKSELGEGGFGKVYLIVRLNDGLECVAKEPKDLEKNLIKALNSEFTVLDNLEQKNVPYVVRAIAMGEYMNKMGNMVPVLITEKAEWEPLDKVMKRGPISEDNCLDIITKVAEALTGVHEAGYIHRDISPDNIFVDDLVEETMSLLLTLELLQGKQNMILM